MFEGFTDEAEVEPEKNRPINRYYKSLLVIILTSVFLVWRYARSELIITECINDRMHYAFHAVNKLMRESQVWKKVLTGIGQFIIDSWFLFLTTLWTLFVKNARFPTSVGIFYLMRSRFLEIEKFPFPHDIAWESPGFLSLTVPYDHTRDFFYSGHTGILVIAFCELFTLKMRMASIVCSVCICYIIFMLLATEVHYTADVFGGFICGLYIHGLISQYVYYFDWLWSVPSLLIRKLRAKIRENHAIKK